MTTPRTYTFDGGIVGRSNGSPAGDAFMRSMIDYHERRKANEARCVEALRKMGVKLAHADDGWVDRERNTITPPSYRLFDDGVTVGDMIAIGSASETGGSFRLAKITKVSKLLFGSHIYHFEPTGEHITFG